MHAFPPPPLPQPPPPPPTESAAARPLSSAASLRGEGPLDGNPSPTRQLSPPPGPHPHPHHHHHQQSQPTSLGLPSPHPSQQLQLHQARSVKRPRPVKSCTECRKRKLRCDRILPCSQCQKSTRACKYAADQDSANLSDGSDVDTSEPNRPPKRGCPSASSGAAGFANNDAAHTPAKNGESPSLPLLEELSLRMERLEKQVRVRSPGTDYSGGRAIAASPSTTRGLTVKREAQGTRFFGQNSTRVLLNLFDDAKALISHQRNAASNSELFFNLQALHRTLQDNLHNAMTPITVFVDSMMPVHKRMTDILPKKPVCDRLIASYFNTSENIYRIVHVPTFYEQYELYWEGKLQSESFLPQLLSVLSISSRFETKSKGLGHERVEGVHIPTAYALVELLLLYAQRMITPRAEDSWTQLGFVVRLAMTMGLHRDPSEFEPRISVFLGELRRRLWFTIVDMDLHMSLACNLPCLVREGDFSCRPPRNLNDSELFLGMQELPPTKPIDQVTDNQMQVYAAMTLGVRMRVAPLINRIDTMRDYQEVVEVGAKLERFLDDINYVFPRHGIVNDSQKSKQWRCRVVLDMHVRRPLLALYRPLAMGVADVPPQISRAYLKSSMVILKYLDELDPHLAHFQEIAEMYHQILKRDIIQAALSVCFYIQCAVRPNSEGLVLGQQALRVSPDSSDDYPSYKAEDLMLWSPARLIETVQKTLDLLIANISGSDIKDIICIALVLETVKSPEPRPQDITRELYGVLDACLRASNLTRDKIHARVDGYSSGNYGQGRSPYGYSGHGGGSNSSAGMRASGTISDFGGWIMWEGWD
ncbi:fungal specific transcription factor [Hirsutella rhossiliensis]|uniref:Fungal specific transcription factor domain-containing protein n=1 Tax=Hirsutella rhossiliensis TaxID=111463 RepID=A0A9P8SFC1_9HYPO|nr:fungal specific transcription factor domain-containing protein [Hirsutella rhossiliensis]KAH0960753.1 fungal specific transcription factor domain-containing protein [Hirsutella rhossiliensis]